MTELTSERAARIRDRVLQIARQRAYAVTVVVYVGGVPTILARQDNAPAVSVDAALGWPWENLEPDDHVAERVRKRERQNYSLHYCATINLLNERGDAVGALSISGVAQATAQEIALEAAAEWWLLGRGLESPAML